MHYRYTAILLLLLVLGSASAVTPLLLIAEASRDYSLLQGDGTPGTWQYQLTTSGAPAAMGLTTPYKWYDASCAGGAQGYFQNSSVAGFRAIEIQPCAAVGQPNITLNWTSSFTGNLQAVGWYLGFLSGTMNFSWRKNGQFVNWSRVGGDTNNQTLNVTYDNVVIGDNLSLQIYNLGDQTGDWGNLTYGFYTDDATHPQYNNASAIHNSTLSGLNANFSLTWTDNIGLNQYIFAFDNGNGTFQNSTPYVFVQNNNSLSNITRLLNGTNGSILRWYWWANDTTNNGNTSEVYSLKTIYAGLFNVSAFDESTAQSIRFSATISNGTSTTTLTNQANYSTLVTSLPSGTITLIIWNNSNAPRTYYAYNNITAQYDAVVNAYLANYSESGFAYSYFQLLYGSTGIQDGQIDFYRIINGVQTLVSSAKTLAGGTTPPIALNSFATYTYNATATGYSSVSEQISGGTFVNPSFPGKIYLSKGSTAEDYYYLTQGNITHSCTMYNNTGWFNCTYSDATGISSKGVLVVERLGALSYTPNCTTTVIASAANISCLLGNVSQQSYRFNLTLFNAANDALVIDQGIFDFGIPGNGMNWGLNGLFVGLLLVIVLFFAGLGWDGNPVTAMGSGYFGMVVSSLLGLMPVGPAALIGLGAIVAIAMAKMQRN